MTVERIPITDRETWLALRQADITASDVGIVCGEGAYGSAAELYAVKKGLRPPLQDSGVLKRGRWGEAAVFEALLDEQPGWQIIRSKIYLRDPELRLGATPDGFAISEDRAGTGIVQCKVISRSVFKNKWLDDPADHLHGEATPPAAYMLQTLTEMMLSNALWGVLAVVINSEYDWTFRQFEVERNDQTESRIVYNVKRFWNNYLDANIMPAFEPQRDERLVKLLYPKDKGTTVDLTGDNRVQVLVEDWQQLTAARKRIDLAEKAVKTELAGKLMDHTFGVLADGRCISYKVQHRKGYVVEPTDYRVMRLLKQKPDEDREDE